MRGYIPLYNFYEKEFPSMVDVCKRLCQVLDDWEADEASAFTSDGKHVYVKRNKKRYDVNITYSFSITKKVSLKNKKQ